MERFDGVVDEFAHRNAKDLVEDGAVEVLDEAVDRERSDPCHAEFDTVEFRERRAGVGIVVVAAE